MKINEKWELMNRLFLQNNLHKCVFYTQTMRSMKIYFINISVDIFKILKIVKEKFRNCKTTFKQTEKLKNQSNVEE